MAQVRANAQIRHTEKPLGGDLRHLQRVVLFTGCVRQDFLYRSLQCGLPVTAQGTCSPLSGQVKKMPILRFDSSSECVAIEIRECSPARGESVAGSVQARGQQCPFLDQDRSGFDGDFHLNFFRPAEIASGAGDLTSARRPRESQLRSIQAARKRVRPRSRNKRHEKHDDDSRHRCRNYRSPVAPETIRDTEKAANHNATDSHDHVPEPIVSAVLKGPSRRPTNRGSQ
jgi:hypothetical protein